MDYQFEAAITAILEAVRNADRELAKYDKHPKRKSEANDEIDAGRRAIAAERDDRTMAAFRAMGAASAEIQTAYNRARMTSFDSVDVQSSWSRIEKMLDAGLGAVDVLNMPGLTRSDCEALRRGIRAHFVTAMKGSSADETARATTTVLDLVSKAEIPLMEPDEARATQAELGRRAVESTLPAIAKYLDRARAGLAGPQDQIEIGYALNDAGYVPPADVPRTREATAEMESNSLDSATKIALGRL